MLNLLTLRRIRTTPRKALFSVLTFSLFVLLPFNAIADDTAKQQALVDNAKITVEKFLADPNMESFQKLAKEAKGLFIVPQILKGAFFFGGEGGSGVLLTRDEKNGGVVVPGILYDRFSQFWLSIWRKIIPGGDGGANAKRLGRILSNRL